MFPSLRVTDREWALLDLVLFPVPKGACRYVQKCIL